MLIRLLLILLLTGSASAHWTENNGKREWAQAKRTKVMVSHELEMISWPGLPDSTYFKVDVGSITDSIWYIGDTTYIGIEEYYDARFYNIGDNNIEWDAILYQQPGNQYSWEFPIEHNNLVFYFQPELTQEEIDSGITRPDSVVGSYAAYHSYKRDNHIFINGNDTTYENYTTGKAFHVYRPRAWDANDSTVWLDITINYVANTLTITGTRAWFRDAVYPVVIDPQFGYTDVGAGEQNTGSDNKMRTITKATTGADAAGATLDSITYYVNSVTSGPYNIIWGLYTDDSGPRDSVTSQTSGEAINATGWTLTTNAFESHSLSASTVYYFANLNTASVSGNLKLASDATPGVVWQYYNSCCKYTDYPDLPGSLAGSTSQEFRCSIYGTYSVAGASESTRRRKIIIGGQ